jgi:hypothetical protein
MATVRHATPPVLALAFFALAGLVGALSVLSDETGRARADAPAIRFGLYLQRADGRSADPVNLIFTGDSEATAAGLHVARVLGWTAVPGSDMAFTDHGATRWTEVQLGSGRPAGPRRHLRLAGARVESERWGEYTLAAVHHDVAVPCGHVGAGFDEERDALAAAMQAAGYRVTWLWLGNDGAVEHCDGSRTHGDGWAAVISLDRSMDAPATPSPTASPSPTPSPLPSPTPSPGPSASPTPGATPTPDATPTPGPTAVPAPSPTPTPMPELPRDLPGIPLDR